MEEFKEQEVQVCFHLLSKAKNATDAVLAWSILQRKYPHLSAMVALSDYPQDAIPYSVKQFTKAPNKYLVSYFSTTSIFFLGDELLTDMFSKDEAKMRIDYSLMFDTNLASYLNKLVRGESLGNIQQQLTSLIDSILHDNLNFDHLFYMIENSKNVRGLALQNSNSKLEFWRALNKDFRRNMVSLQIFRSIDGVEYKRTSTPKARFSYREAVRNAVTFCYDFYASSAGKEVVEEFSLVQRMLLLQLLGMLRIQLSSNKSAKHKMCSYFDFIHDEIGAYFDRESIVAHKYFSERNCFPILEKIKKGMKTAGLLKKLDNIAWDMAAPRFMEKLICSRGQGDFFVPFFLTFDKGLHNLLSSYPIKGVILNAETGKFVPFPEMATLEYFERHGYKDVVEYLFSESVKNERLSRPKPTMASIHRKIFKEYRNLVRAIRQ